MSLQANYPSIRPSLLLDFANAQALDPRVTFTRTSTATYFDGEGVLRTAAADAARFAFDPVTEESLGLLIEESRTNLLTYSEQFDNAYWVKARATITVNAAVAPDGTSTADKLVEDTTATNTHQTSSVGLAITSGVAYSLSLYAKAAERNSVSLGFGTTAFPSSRVRFDLSAGTATTEAGSPTSSIVSVGNGWYRCSITVTATATTSDTSIIYINNGTTVDYTGDGTSGIYVWGAQLEAGAFPTSYIPTVASQVTRAGDLAVMTGANFTSWFNPNESTFYAEASTMSLPANIYHYICSLSLGTSTSAGDFLRMAFLYTSKVDFTVGNSNTFTTLNTTSTPSITVDVPRKSAIAVAAQDLVGVTASWTPSTSAARSRVALVNTLTIGSQAAVSSNRALNGTIKKLAYYPIRLTNAQLQALTA